MKDRDFYQALPYAAVGAVEGVWRYYKPELMWAAIGASVVAYDLLCEEGGTMSESYKKLPFIARAAGATILAAHLIGVPERIDPISRVFKAIK